MNFLFGVFGLVFVLSAFLGRNLKKFPADSLAFNGLTFLGCLGLVIYSYFNKSWVFFALNLVFGLISMYYIYKKVFK